MEVMTDSNRDNINCWDEQNVKFNDCIITLTSKNELEKKKEGNASLSSCVMILLNTVTGAGMLGLPAAMAGAGFVGGGILMCLSCYFSAMGLYLLSLSSITSSGACFYSVSKAAFQWNKSTIFIDFIVGIKCFGVATSFFITISDCLVDASKWLCGGKSCSVLINRQFWVSMALLMVMPISFFKTMNVLRFTNTLSVFIVYFLAIGIILYAVHIFDPCLQSEEISDCRGPTHLFRPFDSTLKTFPVFIFCFTCQQNIFTIVQEIRHRTQRRVNYVVIFTMVAAFAVYLTVAIDGYQTYGDKVMGDILLNYPQNLMLTIMRIVVALMVVLSYPLQLHPSRRCFISIVKTIREWENTNDDITEAGAVRIKNLDTSMSFVEHSRGGSLTVSLLNDTISQNEIESEQSLNRGLSNHSLKESNNDGQRNVPDRLFYVVTFIFLLLSYAIAMIVDDLGVILGVVGATGSTMLTYILPGLLYIKIHPDKHILKYFAYLQFILGLLIVPTALYFVLFEGASG